MQSYADYLMVISLPDNVSNDIARLKKASANLIGHFEGMHATPQLLISHQTRCKPFLVDPALVLMSRRVSTMPPIRLNINGFGHFNNNPGEKTIYAAIEFDKRVDNWFKLLYKQIGFKINEAPPLIAIVQNIPVSAFNKLWPNFAGRKFDPGFTVESLTILQRDTFAPDACWMPHKDLLFGNKLLAF